MNKFTNKAFNVATSLAGLAAVLHVVWFVISFVSFRQRLSQTTTVIVDWDPSIFMMHIRIGVALLISVAALCSRRGTGLLLSVLALAWICTEYVFWYSWSARMKWNAGIENFHPSVDHASNLYGAKPLNVVVLGLVLVVLVWGVWQLMQLTKSLSTQRSNTRGT